MGKKTVLINNLGLLKGHKKNFITVTPSINFTAGDCDIAISLNI